MSRRKRVPPGSRIDYVTASPPEVTASVAFINDFNRALDGLRKMRKTWEESGLDPYEQLAKVFAHNEAVDKTVRRLKRRGPATVKAHAGERAAEIAEQLRDSQGHVKTVAIDRQSSGKKASSESTVRRVKRKTIFGKT